MAIAGSFRHQFADFGNVLPKPRTDLGDSPKSTMSFSFDGSQERQFPQGAVKKPEIHFEQLVRPSACSCKENLSVLNCGVAKRVQESERIEIVDVSDGVVDDHDVDTVLHRAIQSKKDRKCESTPLERSRNSLASGPGSTGRVTVLANRHCNSRLVIAFGPSGDFIAHA